MTKVQLWMIEKLIEIFLSCRSFFTSTVFLKGMNYRTTVVTDWDWFLHCCSQSPMIVRIIPKSCVKNLALSAEFWSQQKKLFRALWYTNIKDEECATVRTVRTEEQWGQMNSEEMSSRNILLRKMSYFLFNNPIRWKLSVSQETKCS